MNLPAAAALRSNMEQSNVPDDTPLEQCRACIGIGLIRVGKDKSIRLCASCKGKGERTYKRKARRIVAVEETRRG